ncbi:MAG TPA: ferredoxin [Pseudonocardiaceae bacterium]|nr:ferredoxin [Pseudonocardiaceae bacterium]
MNIHADTTVCVGAGQCALRAPAVFDQSQHDGTVIVLDTQPGPEHQADVRAAVELCPSGAISISFTP